VPISDNVAIIGVGVTKFGELFDQSYTDLLIDAAYAAYADAGIDPGEIEAAWLGTAFPQLNALLGDDGSSLTDPLNLPNIPVTRVANLCATGMEAVRAAALAVAAGEYHMVLALGVEKMREVSPRGSLVARHITETHPMLTKGRTAPGMFAVLANRYFEDYGYDKSTLAKVAVKNHYNGSLNEGAHFRKPITEDQVLKAPLVADPLGLFDCCPTTDGAAAVILTTKEIAQRLKKDYVLIKGAGVASWGGYFSVQYRPDFDFLGFPATRAAAAQAYRQAGITNPREQIDVAECHDCFTITELINYEDLGFCERGEGGKLIIEGVTTLEGGLPVNVSGGLKATGHPVGATGVRMIAEITNQIRGRQGKRQVKGARTGLAHTLGGPGVISCVMVLGR
jgi:acetyl-CoA C-acetyltransferase